MCRTGLCNNIPSDSCWGVIELLASTKQYHIDLQDQNSMSLPRVLWNCLENLSSKPNPASLLDHKKLRNPFKTPWLCIFVTIPENLLGVVVTYLCFNSLFPSCNGRKRGFTSSSSSEKPGSTIFGVRKVGVIWHSASPVYASRFNKTYCSGVWNVYAPAQESWMNRHWPGHQIRKWSSHQSGSCCQSTKTTSLGSTIYTTVVITSLNFHNLAEILQPVITTVNQYSEYVLV